MRVQCFLFIVVCLGQNTLSAQGPPPKVVVEIPAAAAKYSYEDENEIFGPSSIDVDQNGDIYIGGGRQILVYHKTGELVRTIHLANDLPRRIIDIALSRNDKLYLLKNLKRVFVIDKNLAEVTQDKVLASYFIQTTTAFRRIWIDDNGRCLVGTCETKSYVLDEAKLEAVPTYPPNRRYPMYSVKLNDEREGTPLKWSSFVLSFAQNTFFLQNRKVEVLKAEAEQASSFELSKILPSNFNNENSAFLPREAFASESLSRFFLYGRARPKREFARKIVEGTIIEEPMILVVSSAGNLERVIDKIPDDLVSSGNIGSMGKVFAVSSDGYLYYLYTEGEKSNLASCVTRVIQW